MTDRDRHDQRDPLTGTATLDTMRRFIAAALELSDAQGPAVVLFALGIDGLRDIAASQGEAQVDAVLLGVADRLRGGLRGHDLVGRLPEGFLICLPEAFTAEARRTAARVQRLLEGAPVPTAHGPVALGCSLGLASGRGPDSEAEALIARALAALASAQEAGGSRIVSSP